ncbi:MAG: enoyl-CoA hydratase [Sneathiella sp.]|jgi:enoyl-CoA hydratase|uniref:enoyl-CoA hydratase/isomerase family protein n=1 Tax=Sneathiella sp. TaxID=1964365 RepID=UPI000C584F2F|nr:enoyl-CoA hydratase-related protein [Sneathiella sp.]MAL77808.1 enoyl-CoA hydratase [Sneathiella sp.]|tara:strand:- start:46 stop:837 length:792 start_codon:yes stop_codon:yes gene_type:complete
MFDRYNHIKFDRNGRILRVTLNRPDRLNATNGPLHTELSRVFSDIAEDRESDVVILTGAGKAFSAGGDLDFLDSCRSDAKLFQATLNEGKRLINSLLDLDKPIICRLNGDAMGLGATVALFCDIIIADNAARIADPHVKVGLSAGDGGAVIWPQLIGYARAKQYLLTGDMIHAPQAAEMGLINFAVPTEELDPLVDKWAQKLVNGAGMAIRATKVSVNAGLKQVTAAVLDASFATEFSTGRSDDHGEALKAMREKRRPDFTGK